MAKKQYKERKNKIKVVRYLSLTGPEGPYKPWDEYTPEEHEEFARRAAINAGKAMSKFYQNQFRNKDF